MLEYRTIAEQDPQNPYAHAAISELMKRKAADLEGANEAPAR